MIYKTRGVCSQAIEFEIEDGKIESVQFYGGCPGNLMGISKLVKGRNVEDVIHDLEGVTCGSKSTSCPDQLAKALRLYISEKSA